MKLDFRASLSRIPLVVLICVILCHRAQGQEFVQQNNSGRWMYVNAKGKFDKSITYDTVKPYSFDMAPVMQMGKWGCVDDKNQWIIPPAYDDLSVLSPETFRIKSGYVYGVLNRKGDIVLPPQFDAIDHYRLGYGTVKKNGEWFSLSPNGLSPDSIIFENPDVKAMMTDCPPDEADCSSRKMGMAFYPNIRYPARARENGIQGTVILSAIIDTDGKMKDRQVVRAIYPPCDEEAMRVFRMVDVDWVPAMVDGEPVVSRIYYPLKFMLQ